MDSNLKIAAQKLIDLADRIDKEASDNSYFVCDDCFHTTSLSNINSVRKEASMKHNVKKVACITINDKVACSECGGAMEYVATEDSEKYYIDEPSDESDDDSSEDKEELGIEDPSDEPTEDSSVEDTPEVVEESVSEEVTPEEPIEDYDLEEDPEKPSEFEEEEYEEPVQEEQDAPIYEPVGGGLEEGLGEDSEVEEDKPKKKPKTEVKIPKKQPPMFEKMPKNAGDQFWAAVRKYSSF